MITANAAIYPKCSGKIVYRSYEKAYVALKHTLEGKDRMRRPKNMKPSVYKCLDGPHFHIGHTLQNKLM